MTTKQIQRLKALYAEGRNDLQIAEELGITKSQVFYWRKEKLGLPARHRRRKRKEYTIFDRAGNAVALGTAEECAHALGIKTESVYRMAGVSAKKGDGRVIKEKLSVEH